MQRKDLKADSYYFDRKDNMYAYTPDGEGCIFYTTKQEMFDEHNGPGLVTSVSEILDY